MRVSPAGLEWVVSMRGVCGQARTLRYVCGVFFFFYVFNMTKTFFFISTPLHEQNSRKKSI